MNKSEIVANVADSVNLTRKDAEEAVDAVLEQIMLALKEGDKVVISGFGTFEVHSRKERMGRNPRTGEEIPIPGQVAPVFKASKAFKDYITK